jgi:dipeptidyl aminopeptidase/acylaminoacyl peptidase
MRNLILAALVLAATVAPAQKRPMTFEDMMHMKRLGSTAVSPDGKWLGYSVTTVDLERNTKISELWLQQISGGDPLPLSVRLAADLARPL